MNEKEALQQAVNNLKDGRIILFPTDSGWQLCLDATNPISVNTLLKINRSTPSSVDLSILVNSDRMINQCIKDVPEVAWDMIDYATEALTLILDGGQFVDKRLVRTDRSLAIQKVTEGLTNNLLLKLNRPLAAVAITTVEGGLITKLQKIDHQLTEKVDFVFPERLKHSKKPMKSKLVKIRTNGEIEIIRK